MRLFGLNLGRRPRVTNSERARQNRMALFIVLASLVAVGVYIAMVSRNKSEPIDIRTGCKLGSAVPDAHTVVLIDQTDPLTQDQLDYVKTLIVREYRRLNRYERFTLMGVKALEGASADPAQILNFWRCRVQTGSEAEAFTQSETVLTARFNQLVGKDLAAAIDGLSSTPISENSPIIETIDKLLNGASFASPQIKRRLVVVSDMAQRSARLSHYPTPGYVYAFRNLDGLHTRSSLAGTQIRVHYILRDELRDVQVPDHRRFWAAFFKASGADDMRIGWGLPPDTATDIDAITPIIDTQVPPPESGSPRSWSDEISSESKAAGPAPQPGDTEGGPAKPPAHPTASTTPTTIRVNTTLTRGYIRYEVNWPIRNELAFDARRVLLLALNESAGCYLTIPLATFPAMDPQGVKVADGTIFRRLATYEPSEMDFARRLPMLIETPIRSITFCEAVAVRVKRGANNGVRYRAVRCGGQDLQPIDDITWTQIADATARGAIRLGVVDGQPLLQPDYVEKVKRALRGEKNLCGSAGDATLGKTITHGLSWLNVSIAPPAPMSEPNVLPEPPIAPSASTAPATESQENEYVY